MKTEFSLMSERTFHAFNMFSFFFYLFTKKHFLSIRIKQWNDEVILCKYNISKKIYATYMCLKKNLVTKPEWHYLVLEAITRNNVIIIRRRQRTRWKTDAKGLSLMALFPYDKREKPSDQDSTYC